MAASVIRKESRALGGMLTNISKSYLAAKKNYDRGTQALTGCVGVASECLEALRAHATLRHFGNFSTSNSLAYSVADAAGALSRPYRPELFIDDPKEFEKAAEAFIAVLRDGKPIAAEGFDRIIYTAVTNYSL